MSKKQLAVMDTDTVPPNGGWGWMVVLGAALVNMVNQSMFSVFGLIYGEKLKALSGGTTVGFAFVMSINIMVTNVAGLIVGPLMKVVHLRTITIVGVLLTGTGVICCSFANATWHISVGYGIVTGTGLGLLQSATFLAINSYFTTRKSSAVGLAMAGTSIGQMLLPLLVGYLLELYKFRGTCIAVGCLSFSGLIGAILFKPLKCTRTSSQIQNLSNIEANNKVLLNNNANEQVDNNVPLYSENEEKPLNETRLAVYQSSTIHISRNMQKTKIQTTMNVLTKIIKLLNFSLLKDFTFVNYLVGLSLAYTSSVSFTSFYPMFLREELNMSVKKTTYCMTLLSSADILGRITVSVVAKSLGLGPKGAFMFGSLMLGISRSCLVELTEFNYLLVGSFVAGYFRAPTVIFQNLVISDYIRDERLASAVGLNMVMKGFTVMMCGQFLAKLKDQYNYFVVVHVLDGILFTVVVFWTIQKLCLLQYLFSRIFAPLFVYLKHL